jgi:hypothetical protein
MLRRVYMAEDGDLVRWTGELKQPDIHHIYRSSFNVVDVHNKLSVGPRSVCNVAKTSLPWKLWLYLVACAETNAYLMYVHHHKLSSEQYNHADFKVDLGRELLQWGQDDDTVNEEAGVHTRSSAGSVASGASAERSGQSMPATFHGHALAHKQDKHRLCMVCATRTKWFCECGRAICGTPGNRTCWAWHLDEVLAGTVEEGDVQWQQGKRARV